MRLHVMARAAADESWPLLAPLFESALSHGEGELSTDDIRELVRDERAFVLIAVDKGQMLAAAAVEIVAYPRFKVANIIATGGNRVFLRREELAWVGQIARDMGCAKVQTYCRPSMARLLGKLGMREAYRVMRLDT